MVTVGRTIVLLVVEVELTATGELDIAEVDGRAVWVLAGRELVESIDPGCEVEPTLEEVETDSTEEAGTKPVASLDAEVVADDR